MSHAPRVGILPHRLVAMVTVERRCTQWVRGTQWPFPITLPLPAHVLSGSGTSHASDTRPVTGERLTLGLKRQLRSSRIGTLSCDSPRSVPRLGQYAADVKLSGAGTWSPGGWGVEGRGRSGKSRRIRFSLQLRLARICALRMTCGQVRAFLVLFYFVLFDICLDSRALFYALFARLETPTPVNGNATGCPGSSSLLSFSGIVYRCNPSLCIVNVPPFQQASMLPSHRPSCRPPDGACVMAPQNLVQEPEPMGLLKNGKNSMSGGSGYPCSDSNQNAMLYRKQRAL